ncbi:unnamed protein product [Cuscuta epithymum]|uniref:Uncharacterized protein n=1 Tax=Cuscuta epithymum TaxID=186058 RepID=A0AAV0GJZ9_9ASTE|nr:unnamed protein product [Cuscuta epithymum]
MAVTSHLGALIVFLSFLSLFHDSRAARFLGVINHQPAAEKRFHLQSQHTTTEERLDHNGANIGKESAREIISEHLHHEEEKGKIINNKYGVAGSSSKASSVVSNLTDKTVKTKKKKEEGKGDEVITEAAVFNLDYLPPKTHPPIHN